MNPFELIEKLINEHGSANILRERLTLVREQMAELERLRTQAETKAQVLQSQLDQTKAELQQAQAKLASLQTGLTATLVCGHCGSARLERTGTRPHPVFGQVGLREAVLVCEECQGVTHIELPMN